LSNLKYQPLHWRALFGLDSCYKWPSRRGTRISFAIR
jgi:hypothetical protein